MLAFGTIIGVGWVTVMGSWLGQAGSLGAIFGFLGGGLLMLVIAVCYAEVAVMFPVSGGEVAYVYEMYGTRLAFAAGWALSFNYIVTTAFEAISVGWVASALFPGIGGPVLYSVLGQDIDLGSLLLGFGIMAAISWLNFQGARAAIRFQDLMTLILLLASGIFIFAGLSFGDYHNLQPFFVTADSNWRLAGVLGVMASTPFWFAGFDTIPQAMGEVAESARLRLIPVIIVLSILLSLVFYCLVILAAAVSMPREELLATELPVAGALESALNSPILGKIVLFAGLCGLITTWNAVFFASTRLLYALGRGRMIPPIFGQVHSERGSPGVAILFVGAVGGLVSLLGRNAIVPILSAAAVNFTFVFLLVSVGLILLRRNRPDFDRPFRAPGVLPYLAVGSSLLVLCLAIYEPFKSYTGILPTAWILILIWAGLGGIFWLWAGRTRNQISEAERRRSISGRG